MDNFTFDSGFYRYNITPVIWVGLEYASESTPSRIVSLKDAHVDTSEGYGNKRCEFQGKVAYHLVNGRSFNTMTYGSVYGYGLNKFSGPLEIGIGGFSKAILNVGNPSNFLRTVSFQRDYYSAALDN